jgi:drug/metabolite transporter (DMT)-like permease
VAFQIAVLAWVFLGENLSGLDVIGIVLAVFGAILVQMRPSPQTGT